MDFWDVYSQYHDPIQRFVRAMVRDAWTAEDLVQEAFLKAQAALPGLRDETKVKPWLFRIARNVCLDHLRRARPGEEAGEETGAEPALVQLLLERREMSDCVREKIDLLPEGQRTVLILADLMGMDTREIGGVMGLGDGAVRTRLHRARAALKKILEEDCTFERDQRDVFICRPKLGD